MVFRRVEIKPTVRRLMVKMPRHGLALHGMPFKNAQSVRRIGLVEEGFLQGNPSGLGVPICPIPGPEKLLKRYAPREALRRIMGSINYASGYAWATWIRYYSRPPIIGGYRMDRSWGDVNRKLPVEVLPAMVLLKGRSGKGFDTFDYEGDFLGEEPEGKRKEWFGWNHHGKKIDPKQIAGIVRITKKEYLQFLFEAEKKKLIGKERFDYINNKMIQLFQIKCLKTIRRIIDKK